jgi:hypothetical protein
MSVSGLTLTRPTMSERELQDAVMTCARWLGWRVAHHYDSRRTAPGLPDILAVRARAGECPRILYAELKSDRGRLSAEQRAWLADLARVEAAAAALGQPALVTVCVWRPADWASGEVERVLKGT